MGLDLGDGVSGEMTVWMAWSLFKLHQAAPGCLKPGTEHEVVAAVLVEVDDPVRPVTHVSWTEQFTDTRECRRHRVEVWAVGRSVEGGVRVVGQKMVVAGTGRTALDAAFDLCRAWEKVGKTGRDRKWIRENTPTATYECPQHGENCVGEACCCADKHGVSMSEEIPCDHPTRCTVHGDLHKPPRS